jgi:hypothetical protein
VLNEKSRCARDIMALGAKLAGVGGRGRSKSVARVGNLVGRLWGRLRPSEGGATS